MVGPSDDSTSAHVQMELRDLQAQTKLYERRRPSDVVELVRLEGRQFQYLYSAEGAVHVMDPQTFEQEQVAAELFGKAAAYLVPGVTVTLNFGPDGKAISGARVLCPPDAQCLPLAITG